MKMDEALEWAADYAERAKIFEAPVNNRGYVKDGWKDPSPEEKRAIITQLARDVVDPEMSRLPSANQLLFLETCLTGLDNAYICNTIMEMREWINSVRFPLKSYIERGK